ncbi:MAG: hypothetical protein C4525_16830 [Desulfarculus sp.]|nr:MAG: hypothetical protein C4525_16830 [Desulfarculus sp.]
MEAKRQIEIFSAGCVLCQEAEEMVRGLACEHCQVTMRDMRDPDAAARARELGVTQVPAVAVDGRLAPCCMGQRLDQAALRAAGVGQPL